MFQHPRYPWMLADLDYLTELPNGQTAILEIKTTNYNARDNWWYNGAEIVPTYYEAQGRHYMAVMGIDRVYYCCLYGNSEDEAIIRHIDRDMDYETEMIALEKDFWENNVLAKSPPPYTEDGDLIMESLRKTLGPPDTEAQPINFSQTQPARVARFLELQGRKGQHNSDIKAIDEEMDRLKALIVADMGTVCKAVTVDGFTVTWKPIRRKGIPKEGLERLKEVYPDINF